MIPASWDWQKKTKIWQAGLQSFCFTLPHSRSECTLAHFFVSVFIRVISGFLLSFSVGQCDLLVRSWLVVWASLVEINHGFHEWARMIPPSELADCLFLSVSISVISG